MNNTYSEKTAAAVLNASLRSMRKYPRETLHNAWTDEKGRCCVLENFRGYRLNHAPAGLTEVWTSRPDPERAAAIAADNSKLIAHLFAPLDGGKTVEMPAPDPAAVEAFIKANTVKERGKNVLTNLLYDLGPEYPAVNVKYLRDMLRLFPVARWFVDPDPYRRMVSPIFIQADEGAACLLPVRTSSKPWKAPEPVEAPAPAPVKKPERPANIPSSGAYKYFIYSRPAGEKRFLLSDMGQGTVGVKKMFAPRYTDEHLENIKGILDEYAAANPGAAFQIRTTDGRHIVYTAVPTYSPEKFLEIFAA